MKTALVVGASSQSESNASISSVWKITVVVQQDLNEVVEIPQVIVGEQLVLDTIVDEKLVLYMVDDEQVVLYKFVAMEEVNRIVVVEEMLKKIDYTVVGCTVDCCKMEWNESSEPSISVRLVKVLSLVEACVFGVAGTSTVLN
ncbi:hypothetical protein Tco_1125697 [Tanacetum coccineum]|uniref:Uncharacterized protein n=1 Tax=Tanacetum coccineum TaxID=301880 RepID=A0ABQ5J9P5_9ASTR